MTACITCVRCGARILAELASRAWNDGRTDGAREIIASGASALCGGASLRSELVCRAQGGAIIGDIDDWRPEVGVRGEEGIKM